jgi:hypothetical protein
MKKLDQVISTVSRRSIASAILASSLVLAAAQARAQAPVQISITVELPATYAGQPLGGIDDCGGCAWSDANPNPFGEGSLGVRTTIPTGGNTPISLVLKTPPRFHAQLTLSEIQLATATYVQARNILALAAQLFQRYTLSLAPPTYSTQIVSITGTLAYTSGALICNGTTIPKPSPTAINIVLPVGSEAIFSSSSNDKLYYIYQQSRLYAEAEKIVSFAECLYLQGASASIPPAPPASPPPPISFPTNNFP